MYVIRQCKFIAYFYFLSLEKEELLKNRDSKLPKYQGNDLFINASTLWTEDIKNKTICLGQGTNSVEEAENYLTFDFHFSVLNLTAAVS
jgi:hypothetical protein